MILIFGSSITWGAWDEKGGWAQRIKDFANEKSFATNFENNTYVYPLGISGDTSAGVLKRFDTEINARKWENEKMHIIIEIGTNDSNLIIAKNKNRVPLEEYKDNMHQLVDKARGHDAELIVVGLTPVDKRVDPVPWYPAFAVKQSLIEQYEEALREVCKNSKIPFIDVMRKFTENNPSELLSDGLHPNTKGHELIYKEVLNYLTEKNLI